MLKDWRQNQNLTIIRIILKQKLKRSFKNYVIKLLWKYSIIRLIITQIYKTIYQNRGKKNWYSEQIAIRLFNTYEI